MKILITGATGFIGRRLTEHLLSVGHEVTCLVRKTSDTGFLEAKDVPLVFAEITDERGIEKAFSRIRPDAVFHCAARVSNENEEELRRVNAGGTLNICRACHEHGVKRLVYLSSVSVISGNIRSPLTDDLPYKASNAYGRSKIEAERIVVDYRKKGLRVAVVRPCMVVGEGEPHAIGRILSLVKKRRVPVLDIPGMDSRLQLAYVGNVVQALVLALEKEKALEGAFMVADKEVITIRKFLETLYRYLEAGDPPVVPSPLVRFFMIVPPVRKKLNRFFKHRVYDISRAQDLLGYVPEVSTEEGLRRTAEWWVEKKRIAHSV